MVLSEISVGQTAKLRKLDKCGLSASQRQRLMALGLTPGCQIELVRKAPLGGAMQLGIRGSRICVDNRLAQSIWVEV